MATVRSDAPGGVTADAYVARAKELAPTLRTRSEATNAARRVPAETIDELKEAGLFTLLQPRRYGGSEMGLVPFLDCVTALAAGCGSAGWVFSVVSIHQFHLGLFPREAQDDVWGADPAAILGSSYMPGGRTVAAPGGWRLTGKWKFSSGCHNAEWFIVGGLVEGGEGKPPVPWYFLLPKSDVTIVDNWDTIGLSGTGSNDLAIDDKFVPFHRTLLMQEAYDGVAPGSKVNDYALYRIPMMSVFPLCLSAPGVGVAKGAIDSYVAMMKGFTTRGRGQSVADFPTSQMRLGEASALAESAELLLQRDVRDTMDTVTAGRELTRRPAGAQPARPRLRRRPGDARRRPAVQDDRRRWAAQWRCAAARLPRRARHLAPYRQQLGHRGPALWRGDAGPPGALDHVLRA